MAIVNLTPDSFYAASRVDPNADRVFDEAILRFEADGADFLDFGAESTRPGSDYIDQDEELARLVPAVQRARRITNLPISVDTRKAKVAEAALDAGADVVNDISALRDDKKMRALIAERKIPLVLMHMQNDPKTMQANPSYGNVVEEVYHFLSERVELALSYGIRDLIVDPGIGFGKTLDHNLSLIRALSSFLSIGYPVLVGHSRKGFIAKALGYEKLDAEDRLFGGLGVAAWSVLQGVSILRTHDVKATKEIVTMLQAIQSTELLSVADNEAENESH